MKYSPEPYLPAIGYDPYQVLAEVVSFFSCLEFDTLPRVDFLCQKTLANIVVMDNDISSVSINIHQVLNWHTLPRAVLVYIFHHELLHLIVPPREVDGKLKSHPPEFFKLERDSYLDAGILSRYLQESLFGMVRSDAKHEQINVLPQWKKCTAERFIPLQSYCERNNLRTTGEIRDVDNDIIRKVYGELGLQYQPRKFVKNMDRIG